MSLKIKDIFLASLGVFAFTKEKAQELVKQLVEKGEITKEESESMLHDFVEKGEKTKMEIKDYVKDEITRIMRESNLASQEKVEELEERIYELEEKLKVTEKV
jgi:polyhydroxyalkanoate synthesis regulator phasin